MRRIMLFGPNGQIGWELQRSLAPLGIVDAIPGACLDLAGFDKLEALLRDEPPDIIVNAAGYTDVDRVEAEPETASRINVEAVRSMAEAAAKTGALLVHYSSDYVFDGSHSGVYTEEDRTRRLNVYGSTKEESERAIRQPAAGI